MFVPKAESAQFEMKVLLILLERKKITNQENHSENHTTIKKYVNHQMTLRRSWQ